MIKFLSFVLLLFCAVSHADDFPNLPEGYELGNFSNESFEQLISKGNKEEAPLPEVPYLEALPSSFVAGCVNVISGDFCESDVDLVIPGPKPLVLQRSWCSGDKEWHFGHKPLLQAGVSDGGNHVNIFYTDDNGSGLIFRGPIEGSTKKITIASDAFEKALHNCGSHEISGQTNWKNAAMYYLTKEGSDHFLFRHGSHVDRIFGFFKDRKHHSLSKFKLEEEHHPGQPSFFYSYDKRDHLSEVRSLDRGKVLQSVTISKANKGRTVTWSSEKDAATYLLAKKGKRLIKAQSSQGVPVLYWYDDKKRIERKILPEGRVLSIDYRKSGFGKGKVKSLKAPVGNGSAMETTHTFEYGKGCTFVKDALGHVTEYLFKKKRLKRIDRFENDKLLSTEQFSWDSNGNLLSRKLKEKGTTHFVKKLKYDAFGNVAKEILLGNLTGNGTSERYVKTYRATQDGWNLPVVENDGTLRTRFAYYPKTNLLKSRFTGTRDTILKREFFEYDPCGTVIKEILDDGNSEDPDNLSGVTERHIKTITPTQSFPFGLPERVDEMCLDLESGQTIALKSTFYAYSPQGKKIREICSDSNGDIAFTLEWEYDSQGNLLSEKDALGQTVHYSYDLNGNKIAEQHPHFLKQFVYDKANRLVQEEELWPDGTRLCTSHRYNVLSQKEATADCFGNETSYFYNGLGHLIEIRHPSSGIETFTNDALGNKIQSVDPLRNLTQTKYTARSQPFHIEHPDGSVERKEYYLDGRLKKEIGKNGLETLYKRDPFGRVVNTIVIDPSGQVIKTTSAVYNAFHLLSETDEEGNLTCYTYDFAGRKIREETRFRVTTFAYDTLGRQANTFEWTAPDAARVTIRNYDLLDRVIEERIEDLKGEIFKRELYGYDAVGNRTMLTTFTQTGPSVTRTFYTPHGKPCLEVDALGNETITKYDFAYPHNGKTVLKVVTVDPLGNQKVILLDPYGNKLQESRLDSFGKVLQQETHEYDLCQRRISTRTLNGQVIEWEYDPMGNIICQTEAKGTSEERTTLYFYNLYGQKIRTLTPNGITLDYEYDILGRQTTLKSSDFNVHYTYVYDSKDRPLEVENCNTCRKTFRAYDSFGRLKKETLETGLQVEYAYDALDRLVLLTLPDATAVRCNYDACRLLSIDRIKNGEILYTHKYLEYDLSGNPIAEQLIGSSGILKRTYDPLHRVASMEAPNFQEDLSYDLVGNVILRAVQTPEGIAEYSYVYDSLYQLVKEAGEMAHHYHYDTVCNRVEKDGAQYTVNVLNQLISESGTSYTYDNNGNLTQKISDGQKTIYSYDPLNRLIEVKTPTTHVTYSYDAFHRRLEKRCDEHSEQYIYQKQSEIGAVRGGKIAELRVLGKGLAAEIGAAVAIELAKEIYTPVNDASGNVALLLDTFGNPVERYRYSAFGETDTKTECPWGYSGKRFEPETGFLYFGKRYYAPDIGRWITPDPAGFEDGLNLYLYVHNCPLTHIDPDGEFSFLIPFIANLALSCAADYLLPIAAAGLEQYAGGTTAAFLSGVISGYTGKYNGSEVFSGDLGLGLTEKAGMAVGTILSVSPSKVSAKTITQVAKSELAANAANHVVSKTARASTWFGKSTARKAASETTATTVEKTTKVAAKNGVSRAAHQGIAKLDLDALSKAGQVMDRNGLTVAGRSLDKHGNRMRTPFPKAIGNPTSKNQLGQFHLDDILTHPKAKTIDHGVKGFEIFVPDGRGVHFRVDGRFRGFVE